MILTGRSGYPCASAAPAMTSPAQPASTRAIRLRYLMSAPSMLAPVIAGLRASPWVSPTAWVTLAVVTTSPCGRLGNNRAESKPFLAQLRRDNLSKMSRHPALAPFQIRSFRFQWPADLLTSWAFEMETLILGWYVLVETGSVLLLTVFGALGYGGTLIAPMIGVLSDRVGHRAVLATMRAVYAAVAAALMTLAFAGALSPLLVCALAAITGIVRPSDMGMRGALIADTMPFDRL